MKPDVQALSPEQKRALLARLLKQQAAVCKTAFILQGLYLDCILSHGPVWNMRSTVRFLRKQDPELLRSRTQRTIDRHPALRTTYHVPKENEIDYHAKVLMIRLNSLGLHQLNSECLVEQRVHENHQLEFKVVDARAWSAEQVRQALLADALEPFDMGKLPVCRLRLYQREKEDIMQFDVHHCAADLWSLEQIMAELEVPPEDPPPPDFAEFCAWQHAWFALPKAEEMRNWWVRELAHCPDLAFPHSEGDDHAFKVFFRLEGDIVEQARQICRSHKITMFNLMLSTLQATLAADLCLDDFAIGGAVANRPHQRFNQTVGFFAQLVLYRRKLHEIKSWQQLWEANRNTIQEVVDRQFFPVVTSLPVPRTDVWIMFQQYQKARWVQDDLEREDLGMRSGGLISSPLGPWEFLFVDPHFNSSPVQLEIVEQKDSLQGILHYRVSCFSKKKARFYVEDFQKRLRASLADPTAPIE